VPRLALITSAVALAGSLAACSGGGHTSSTSTTPGTVAPDTASSAPAVDNEAVYLASVRSWAGSEDDSLAAAIRYPNSINKTNPETVAQTKALTSTCAAAHSATATLALAPQLSSAGSSDPAAASIAAKVGATSAAIRPALSELVAACTYYNFGLVHYGPADARVKAMTRYETKCTSGYCLPESTKNWPRLGQLYSFEVSADQAMAGYMRAHPAPYPEWNGGLWSAIETFYRQIAVADGQWVTAIKARDRSALNRADTQIDSSERRFGKIVVNDAAKVMPRPIATYGTDKLPFSIGQLVWYPATKQTARLARQRSALAALAH
jgi:hypothetical protein